MKDTELCPICYESFLKIEMVGKCTTDLEEDCQHMVCLDCLYDMAAYLPENEHRCPLCREDWEEYIYEFLLEDEYDEDEDDDPFKNYYESICCPVYEYMPLYSIEICNAFYQHKYRTTQEINPLIRLHRSEF